MATKTDSIIFCGPYGAAVQDRGENALKRWHPYFIIQQETLASHIYDVVENSWIMAKLLIEKHAVRIDWILLFIKAIFHDTEERGAEGTGDLNHVLKKRFSPAMRAEFYRLCKESVDTIISKYYPEPLGSCVRKSWVGYNEDGTIESQIVKVADRLSAVNFLEYEIKLGNGLVREEFVKSARTLISLPDTYPWLKKIWEDIFGQTPQELEEKIKKLQADGE